MRTRIRASAFFGLIMLVAFLVPPALHAATSSVFIEAQAVDGAGTAEPGVACADGGFGDSWTYAYSPTVSSGPLSSSSLVLDLELRSDATGAENPADPTAWLHGDETSLTFSNERGTLVLSLSSGSCGQPTLAFDGSSTSGSGTWAVASASGSYRQAVGSGTFSLDAEVGPGAGNSLDLDLGGSISVLDPALAVEVVRAKWDGAPDAGFHYATVTYLVTNAGVGDAFGVRLTGASSGTAGIVSVESLPEAIGDIAAGESSLMQVRYRFDSKRVCVVKGEGCAFDAGLSIEMPDALDAPATFTTTERVRVPTSG